MKNRISLLVCGGTGCIASESNEMITALNTRLEELNMTDEVTVIKTGCFGFCGQGPIIKVQPDNVFYVKVKLSDIDEIIDEHIVKGRVLDRLLYEDPKAKSKVKEHKNMDFYKNDQTFLLYPNLNL
jgi:NADP-reducing hydrogenase subunit HndC